MSKGQDSTVQNSKSHFVISLDTRSTIIEGHRVRINGGLAGISFGKKNHKITVGYYWLGYQAAQRLVNWHKHISSSINLSFYTANDVEFVSFAYWFPLVKKDKWTVSFPVEFGVGQETSHYRQIIDDSPISHKHFHFEPYQIGVYGEYRVLPWAGLDAQIGYRNAISQSLFRRHFRGVYYSYGISLYPETLYQDFKKWRGRRK